MRGTFANVRLRNQLAPGTEGGWTTFQPSGEQMSIFDAAMKYQAEETPLIVLAGKEYGTGSSRDWAAKGTNLLGVKAVITESFERIHRSNLVGMGVLPLNFMPGESADSLGLTGKETFDIEGLGDGSSETVTLRQQLKTVVKRLSRPACVSTRPRKRSTTAMAVFCNTCCVNSLPDCNSSKQTPAACRGSYCLCERESLDYAQIALRFGRTD